MKKIFLILSLALAMTTMAQKPRIAVYVTGEDPINEIIASRLLDGLARNGKYTTIERTSSFLNALSKEHTYERTGAVDDEQIAALGRQFSVQYVCVVSVKDVWGEEKYITARIIDVETTEIVASCSSNGSITSSSELIGALNKLSDDFLTALDYYKQSGAKKVAVYVTRTGNKDVDIILGDQLVAGFAKSGKYIAIERTNSFLNQIRKETGYQQSGAVDDDDLTRLGKQFGVQYVCVAKTTSWAGDYFISSRLIDVASAEVVNTYNIEGRKLSNSSSVVAVAQEVAKKLSGRTIEEEAEFQKAEAIRLEQERKRKLEEDARRAQYYIETAFDLNMKMIYVGSGEFLMGCTSEQSDCDNDEKNVRKITMDGFYIGMLTVTQSQWNKVMGTSIYGQRKKADWEDTEFNGTGSNYPMYYVSWYEAMDFCRILSQKTGKEYTLPTEAQWEYAARGGHKNERTKYAGSNNANLVAWYCDNSSRTTHPCGLKQANELGIYDMSGNITEWCKDWYSDAYIIADTINPVGPSSGDCRVLRGGQYDKIASFSRVSWRSCYGPDRASFAVGFRVVCIP